MDREAKKRLLAVPHFHCIFTLPHEYLALWRYNEALFARLLFRASQESLLELLADRKYGGIKHRKKRAATQWLEQRQLIKRLLEHVPAEGVHTICHTRR